MRIPEGFKCDEGIRPHLVKVFNGEYDVPVVAHRPLTILDLGANCGAFALWAAEKWRNALIYCYEPHPETFKKLEHNIRFAPDGTQFSLKECAVGNKEGFTHLIEGMHNSGEATILPHNPVSSGTVYPVKIITPLSLPEADIIKMDIEGCEVDVLQPLIESGRRFTAIMFEYHRVNDRRILDNLLTDYVLTGANIPVPGIGVMRYVHKDVMWRHLLGT